MNTLTHHLFDCAQLFWAAFLLLAIVVVWIAVIVLIIAFAWGSLTLRPKAKVVMQPVVPLKK
jgi:hypothetical protein